MIHRWWFPFIAEFQDSNARCHLFGVVSERGANSAILFTCRIFTILVRQQTTWMSGSIVFLVFVSPPFQNVFFLDFFHGVAC